MADPKDKKAADPAPVAPPGTVAMLAPDDVCSIAFPDGSSAIVDHGLAFIPAAHVELARRHGFVGGEV